MYLRNKKTGEVVDWSFVGPTAIKEYEGKDVLLERERYESIEEFISEWEDYEPKEPLIKDEKIRRAVRAWAESWENGSGNSDRWAYWEEDGEEFHIARGDIEIFFPVSNGVKDGEYTIAELCGEEEE